MLRRAPAVDTGKRGKCGGYFFDHRGFYNARGADTGKHFGKFGQAERDDFRAGSRNQIVGCADDKLEMLFRAFWGIRIAIFGKACLVENPLDRVIEQREIRLIHYRAIEPEMDSGDGRGPEIAKIREARLAFD